MDQRTAARLTAKITVDPDSGCWLWTGCRTRKGYALARVGGQTRQLHRAIYEAVVGSIPSGLTLDHLCRVRYCVNPAHMEPITNHANIMRGAVPTANREMCKNRRHWLVDVGVHVDSEGTERCRQCWLDTKRAYRLRHSAA